MRQVLERFLIFACAVAVVVCSAAAAEEAVYANPLLTPDPGGAYAVLPEKMINILLLGVDYGHKGYWGSGHKTSLEDCHTDAVLVVSVHPESKKVDLVSLPRDTLVYVPGVRGIYKLNAAVNCAPTVGEGLRKACETVSWFLGNVPIDYYCAVDMNMMESLGDAVGGVDFDVEMSYTGHSGTEYTKGLQHLNGTGIMDYLRSRTNATVNANDIGRTNRQRKLITAILEKLRNDSSLIFKAIQTALDGRDGFFTNLPMTGADMMSAVSFALSLNADSIGSHVFSGAYRTALQGWNFTFTDQDHRREVIKQVYGIDVAPLPYVGFEYTKWLVDSGLHTVHMLSVASELKTWLEGQGQGGTADERDAADAFLTAYADTKDAFEKAADTLDTADTKAMMTARNRLREAGDVAANALGYPAKLPWSTGKYWYADTYVNEVSLDWK